MRGLYLILYGVSAFHTNVFIIYFLTLIAIIGTGFDAYAFRQLIACNAYLALNLIILHYCRDHKIVVQVILEYSVIDIICVIGNNGSLPSILIQFVLLNTALAMQLRGASYTKPSEPI